MDSKLNILIIHGTSRPNNLSKNAANLVHSLGKEIPEIEVTLVHPNDFKLPFDGNDKENKDPKYSKLTAKADGFFIVTPEYNHSFPGTLKRLLDSELENYIHKPVAFAGISDGQWGGARCIESLVLTVREMGMTATFTDVNFPFVQNIFDETGNLKDDKYVERVNRVYKELIWMAKALKNARNNF